MKSIKFILSGVVSLVFISACGNNEVIDPDKDALDNSPSMSETSCQSSCTQFEKELEKHENTMLANAGCGNGAQEGELLDGQATGILSTGTSYFCPNRAATDKLAEAVSDKTNAHEKALKSYKDNCPCMLQLFQCSICAEGSTNNFCVPSFFTKEECEAKGGYVLGG